MKPNVLDELGWAAQKLVVFTEGSCIEIQKHQYTIAAEYTYTISKLETYKEGQVAGLWESCVY